MISICKEMFYLLSVIIMSVIVQRLLLWECCICEAGKANANNGIFLILLSLAPSLIFWWKKGVTKAILSRHLIDLNLN